MELLASGRDGEIFAYAPGLVLRRTRAGRSLAREARVMELVAAHGFPVPAVHELREGDTELVMERIDGPMMLDVVARRPWTVGAQLRVLADLHDQLHAIEAPDWLPNVSDGDRLLHLDLHPMNVMMSARGPVVIDWTNASRGAPLTDVAMTYVLLTCPRIPGPRVLTTLLQPVRRSLGERFARRYRGRVLDDAIAQACDLKSRDPNMAPDEVAAMTRLGLRKRTPRGGGAEAPG